MLKPLKTSALRSPDRGVTIWVVLIAAVAAAFVLTASAPHAQQPPRKSLLTEAGLLRQLTRADSVLACQPVEHLLLICE